MSRSFALDCSLLLFVITVVSNWHMIKSRPQKNQSHINGLFEAARIAFYYILQTFWCFSLLVSNNSLTLQADRCEMPFNGANNLSGELLFILSIINEALCSSCAVKPEKFHIRQENMMASMRKRGLPAISPL